MRTGFGSRLGVIVLLLQFTPTPVGPEPVERAYRSSPPDQRREL